MTKFDLRAEKRAKLIAEKLERHARLIERVTPIVKKFNGAIKYIPMIQDDPELTEEECIAFAKKWHAVAIERLRNNVEGWNEGIPYCRNIPTPEMLKEAGR